MAFQFMYDGNLNPEVLAVLETGAQVIVTYQVTTDDEAAVVPAIPSDYAEMPALIFLGYESV